MPNQETPHEEKQVGAYRKMMERVKDDLEQRPGEHWQGIHHYIEAAKENAVTLGELTREEAERIGDYLRRDLHDAAEYLSGDSDLANWLRFDISLVEERILDMFSLMVDETRQELEQLAARAEAMSTWRTGEITGPGSLRCENCGEVMQFHKPGRIPPCPKCHGSEFQRLGDEEGKGK